MAPIGKSALVEFSALSVTTCRMVGAAACFWLLSLFCKREQVDHRDKMCIRDRGYTFFYARNAIDTYQRREGTDAEGHELTGSNNIMHICLLYTSRCV